MAKNAKYTFKVKGLSAKEHKIVFSLGEDVVDKAYPTVKKVNGNPNITGNKTKEETLSGMNIEYAIKAKLSSNNDDDRLILTTEPGTTLNFDIEYYVKDEGGAVASMISSSVPIDISVSKKDSSGNYGSATVISTKLVDLSSMSSPSVVIEEANVPIPIPNDASSGTYRYTFKFGDAQCVYNVIIK